MWRRTWIVFSQTVTVALAVLFVVLTLKPQWLALDGVVSVLPAPTLIQAGPDVATVNAAASATGATRPSSADAPATGFALAARRAAPAVVSVTATKLAQRSAQSDDPRFRFFFDERGNGAPQRGLGSGVIVSREGYLLTNHHVIEDANEIEVQLADGRQAGARLVGSDPETDIAVLKIELDALPVITLGDIRALQVGDAVLAIGNPFNVGQTVTSGIVSALDRNRMADSPFQNFIQTDAAINPGNSGGALVNAAGHLVGINTAIFSRTGGSLGIGFAVPVDTAQRVMEALVRGGTVRRGWIGVEPRDLSAELAASLNLPLKHGVLITGVLQGGPAARGGVRPGDVVVRVGDKPVMDTRELLAAVAALQPESTTLLGLQRGAQSMVVQVRIAERPKVSRRPAER